MHLWVSLCGPAEVFSFTPRTMDSPIKAGQKVIAPRHHRITLKAVAEHVGLTPGTPHRRWRSPFLWPQVMFLHVFFVAVGILGFLLTPFLLSK